MRVMIDTNILISAILFPSEKFNTLIEKLTENHKLFLCSYVLDEMREVITRKFKSKFMRFELFLQKLNFELVNTPEVDLLEYKIHIRDKKDYPVLMSAILSEMDILITGDKDFQNIKIDKPEFLNKY